MSTYVLLMELVPSILIGLVGGIWLSFRNFRKMEKAAPQGGQLLLSWKEGPRRPLLSEPKFCLVVVGDAIANLLLAVTIVRIIAQMMLTDPLGPVRTLGYAGGYVIFLWWFGIINAWCWVGVSLQFLVRSLQNRIEEVSVFEGGVKGRTVFAEWKRFGGYRIKEALPQIELFSPRDERLVLFTLEPSTSEQFEALKQILSARIATAASKRPITLWTAANFLSLFTVIAAILIWFNPSYVGAILAIGMAWLIPEVRRMLYRYYGVI